MAGHGRLFDIPQLPGFVAELAGDWVAHVAFLVEGPMLEVVWIGSSAERSSARSALLAACASVARGENLDHLVDHHQRQPGRAPLSAEASGSWPFIRMRWMIRSNLKPEIPLVGSFGIPMREGRSLELHAPNGMT